MARLLQHFLPVFSFGLALDEKVAALQEIGNGLGLDGGGGLIAFAIEGAKQNLGEAEIGKFGH